MHLVYTMHSRDERVYVTKPRLILHTKAFFSFSSLKFKCGIKRSEKTKSKYVWFFLLFAVLACNAGIMCRLNRYRVVVDRTVHMQITHILYLSIEQNEKPTPSARIKSYSCLFSPAEKQKQKQQHRNTYTRTRVFIRCCAGVLSLFLFTFYLGFMKALPYILCCFGQQTMR